MLFEELAQRFPTLYVAPGPDAEDAYKLAFTRGIVPAEKSLSHFVGSESDWLRVEQTPAGPVEVLFLSRREDFETFLRCTVYRGRLEAILPSVGAMTIGGLPDWRLVRAGEKSYRITLVLISEGPYSALPAERTPYGEDEWIEVSRDIRLYHELAHVVCRRLMPGDVLPVWDELTADFHGLLRATGNYDPALARAFMDLRHAQYLTEEQLARKDEVLSEIGVACNRMAELVRDVDVEQSYELLLSLKREALLDY